MYIFPTYLPTYPIYTYLSMQRQSNDICFLDVTGDTHNIIGKSGGYIVMGMGKKKKCPC